MSQFAYDYKVMIVAEKPSISKAIACYLYDRSLSDTDLIDFDEEHTCVQKVYGEFQGKPTKFIVTSTKGKLYSYESRDDGDPIDCFDKEIMKCPINVELNDLLSDYAEDSDFLILWLDNDDAGENISVQVIKTVENRLRKGCQIIRTYIQSVDQNSIGQAFRKVEYSEQGPNYFQSQSVDVKHDELDPRIRKDYKVMIVAEKPSISKAIAGYLSAKNDTNFTDFREKETCVQQVDGKFKEKPTKFIITSTKGKLYSYEFRDRRFQNTDPIACFDKEIRKRPINRKLNKLLRQYANDSDFLILWLDNDDAGENICFEVIETVEDRLRNGCQIIRTYIQSVDQISIGQALKEAEKSNRQPNIYQSLAVEAKHILDLRIGIAFTQMQTQYCRQSGVAFQSKYVSYGPCQIPTLYLVAERDMEIDSYKKNPKYQINCYVKVKDNNYKAIMNKIFDTKEEANRIHEVVSSDNQYTVMDTEQTITRITLKPLNTLEYLKACSEQFKIGSEKALSIAQKLYSKSYITYPRTENEKYSDNTRIQFDKLQRNAEGETKEMISEAKSVGIPKGLISHKCSDHDPIIPTGVVPDPQNPQLNEQDFKVYWFIVRHAMATILLNIRRINYKTHIIHNQSGEQFTMEGIHQESFKYEDSFPQFKSKKQKMSEPIFKATTEFNSTKTEVAELPPPMLISESELLTQMDKHGIGTDASQASHIQKIITRGYVKVTEDRKLTTTKIGQQIIKGYKNVDEELVEPTLRSDMEEQTKMIATRAETDTRVIANQLNKFKEKFLITEQNLHKIFPNLSRRQYQQ